MQFKFAFVAAALTTLVLGTPTPDGSGGSPANTCSTASSTTGVQLCCQSTLAADSALGELLLGLLGIVLDDVTGLLASDCTAIIGTGGCSAQAVCCENNADGGLVSIGCIAIQL